MASARSLLMLKLATENKTSTSSCKELNLLENIQPPHHVGNVISCIVNNFNTAQNVNIEVIDVDYQNDTEVANNGVQDKGEDNLKEDNMESGEPEIDIQNEVFLVSSTDIPSQLTEENPNIPGDHHTAGNAKRKKCITRDKRQKEKRKRLLGKEYESLKKIDGKYQYVKSGQSRELNVRCNSEKCLRTNRFCSKFSEEERHFIFDTFWTKMTSWNSRKAYVSTLVDVKHSQKQKENSRRSVTLFYYLKKDSQKFAVCKKMFLSTLGLKEWSVRNWCLRAEKNTGMHSNENEQLSLSHVRLTQRMKERKLFLQTFLEEIPKLPSHYCRSSSSKLYLEPVFQNKNDIYRQFQKYALEHNVEPLSRNYFVQELDRQNIALFRPKKDQCDLCMAYHHDHIEEADYQAHQRKKTEAREQKAKDKEMAVSNPGQVLALTLDMQAVKLAPFLRCTSIYFKKKLCVHNYTLFDLRSKDVYCFLWDETQASLDATNIASILYKFLDTYIEEHPKLEKIILISDGCGYQNRNTVLSNALLHLAITRKVMIVQNYLEKGHTQMEVDSAHSLIERKLKNKDIYLPTDYIHICREARPTKPFVVKYLKFDDFLDLTSLKYYSNIRPGYKIGDPTVSDIRSLCYDSKGEISYKLNYSDEWKMYTKRPNLTGNFPISQHYTERLKIKADKFSHLQLLKKEMDSVFWQFYDEIPHI